MKKKLFLFTLLCSITSDIKPIHELIQAPRELAQSACPDLITGYTFPTIDIAAASLGSMLSNSLAIETILERLGENPTPSSALLFPLLGALSPSIIALSNGDVLPALTVECIGIFASDIVELYQATQNKQLSPLIASKLSKKGFLSITGKLLIPVAKLILLRRALLQSNTLC